MAQGVLNTEWQHQQTAMQLMGSTVNTESSISIPIIVHPELCTQGRCLFIQKLFPGLISSVSLLHVILHAYDSA
jgi:hypothetical protein